MLAHMAAAGWYPDPSGDGARLRYWDGTRWTEQTTGGAPAGKRGRSAIWTTVIVGLASIIALAIVLAMLTGGSNPTKRFSPAQPDTNSASPSVTGWDETTRPSAPPTQGELKDCPRTLDRSRTNQRNDGWLRGGRLAFQRIPDWGSSGISLQWVSDLHSQVTQVRPGWMSNLGVGQLNAADGFTDPETSARQTMECFASSGYYINFTHRVDLINEPYTVSGHPAWRMRSEVHISSRSMPEIDGDVVEIVVVDYGDPNRMGVFISSITIGDVSRQRLHDAAFATLRVE